MTLRLDLLRHGETELGGGLRGSLDDALTANGWRQMRDAVVGQGPWDRLISSPLQRCALFAQELGAKLDVPVTLETDLQELHFGAWEGQSAAALMDTDAAGLGSGPTSMNSRRRKASRSSSFPRACLALSGGCIRPMLASACC